MSRNNQPKVRNMIQCSPKLARSNAATYLDEPISSGPKETSHKKPKSICFHTNVIVLRTLQKVLTQIRRRPLFVNFETLICMIINFLNRARFENPGKIYRIFCSRGFHPRDSGSFVIPEFYTRNKTEPYYSEISPFKLKAS